MKKIKSMFVVLAILAGSVGFSHEASAEDKGVWNLINSTFEDGAWQLLEHCEGIGNGCNFGDYRARTITPE